MKTAHVLFCIWLWINIQKAAGANLFLVCNVNSGIQVNWHRSLDQRASIEEAEDHCLCKDHTAVGGPQMQCGSGHDGKTMSIYRHYYRYGKGNFFVASWIEATMLDLKCFEGYLILHHCEECKKPWYQLYDAVMQGVNIRREFTTRKTQDKSLTSPTWYQDAEVYKDMLNKDLLHTIIYANMSTSAQDGMDFEIRNRDTVIWKAFRLDKISLYWEHCKESWLHLNCHSELFMLPNEMFENLIKVGPKAFTINNADTSPDLQYAEELANSWKKRTGKLVKLPGDEWGFRGAGCSPPYLKLKVEWYRSTTPALGRSRRRRLLWEEGLVNSSLDDESYALHHARKLTQSNQRECYGRKITVLEVLDSGRDNRICNMPYSMNKMRELISASRAGTEFMLRSSVWSQERDGAGKIYFSPSVTRAFMECAVPTNLGTQFGGRWVGFSEMSPGTCVECSSGIGLSSNMQSRACSPAEAVVRSCCYTCRPRYMFEPGTENAEVPKCIAECRPGQEYTSAGGRKGCVNCPLGKYSRGGALHPCTSCLELGFWNAKATSVGCVACGSRFHVSDNGAQCIACPFGTFVSLNASICRPCPIQGGYFLPFSGEVTSCLACPAGTFMDYRLRTISDSGRNQEVSEAHCLPCPLHMFSHSAGQTQCLSCPRGKRSVSNRTLCTECEPIDSQRFPFTVFAESGCQYRCNLSISYSAGNPYSEGGGCVNCSTRILGAGTYLDLHDCSVVRRCSNPSPTAPVVYVGPAPFRSSECPWKCSPGFQKTSLEGGSCQACPSGSGYLAEKHRYTSECAFTCKERLRVTPTLECNEACVDLLSSSHVHRIMRRVRDYRQQATRPNYVIGACGSDENVPLSDLPLLRKGRWAYIDTSGKCGNYLLNDGEECDDGNTNSGDGCSSSCRVEVDKYWDCDLIGEKCLPNCGWKVDVGSDDDWGLNLRGFVLPSCQGECVCTPELNYYDVSTMPVGQRRIHMMSHFVSCNCGGNVMRQLSYEECTAENRGCRQCSSGQYHDDLLQSCVRCGSMCSVGFAPDATNQSLCHTATEDAGDADLVRVESRKGCVACPRYGDQSIRFLPSHLTGEHCSFACYKDSTDSSEQSQDFYCSSKVDNKTGACRSSCLSCSTKMGNLLSQTPLPVGKFLRGCLLDGSGYEWALCDPSSKPEHSAFVSHSNTDERGCSWQCDSNTHFDVFQGKCLPCFDPNQYLSNGYPCAPGDYTVACSGLSPHGMRACVKCQGITPYPLQTWTSEGPFFLECKAQCEPGISWSANYDVAEEGSGACIPCSMTLCDLGEKYVPCTQWNDTQCANCFSIMGQTQATIEAQNLEFFTRGSCTLRCVRGYYWNSASNACLRCLDEASKCALGTRISSLCELPEERLASPFCVACDEQLDPNEQWMPGGHRCETLCAFNYVRHPLNGTCVAFEPKLCKLGFAASTQVAYHEGTIAVTQLVCSDCALINSVDESLRGKAWDYEEPGECSVRCLSGYEKGGSGSCIASSQSAPPQDAAPVKPAANPYFNKTFPVRKTRHSKMQA